MIVRILLAFIFFVAPCFAGSLQQAHEGVIATINAAGGLPPGTVLLGNSDTGITDGDATLNASTAYGMCATGQESAPVGYAYYYHRLASTESDLHVCITNSSGTLLGCSGAISTAGGIGWKSVAWSGPTITQSTSYRIYVVSPGSLYTRWDTTSPAYVGTSPEAETYGSEDGLSDPSCSWAYGSYTTYVTN